MAKKKVLYEDFRRTPKEYYPNQLKNLISDTIGDFIAECEADPDGDFTPEMIKYLSDMAESVGDETTKILLSHLEPEEVEEGMTDEK